MGKREFLFEIEYIPVEKAGTPEFECADLKTTLHLKRKTHLNSNLYLHLYYE